MRWDPFSAQCAQPRTVCLIFAHFPARMTKWRKGRGTAVALTCMGKCCPSFFPGTSGTKGMGVLTKQRTCPQDQLSNDYISIASPETRSDNSARCLVTRNGPGSKPWTLPCRLAGKTTQSGRNNLSFSWKSALNATAALDSCLIQYLFTTYYPTNTHFTFYVSSWCR